MSGAQLVSEARTLLGSPYTLQGRSAAGIDCAGVILVAGKAVGVFPQDYQPSGYGWTAGGEIVQDEIVKWADLVFSGDMTEQDLALLQEGDVGIFEILGEPQHLGIFSLIDYGSGGQVLGLIHATNMAGKVVEHRFDTKWRRRIVQVWRFKWLS